VTSGLVVARVEMEQPAFVVGARTTAVRRKKRLHCSATAQVARGVRHNTNPAL